MKKQDKYQLLKLISGVILFSLFFVLSGCNPSGSKNPFKGSVGQGSGDGVLFQTVLPIFKERCMACHGSQAPNWTKYEEAKTYALNGKLKQRVVIKKDMPQSGSPQAAAMTDKERGLIDQWIQEGARLNPGEKPSPPPEVPQTAWAIAESCTGCHGDQNPNSDKKIPMLSGQNAQYISDQLINFKSGDRKNKTMEGVAKGLSDEEIKMVSQIFSAINLKQETVEEPKVPSELSEILPTCLNCHASEVKGNRSVNDNFPNIAGQNKDYLFNQLKNFKSDARKDEVSNFMNEYLKDIKETQLEQLAQYFSQMRLKKLDPKDAFKGAFSLAKTCIGCHGDQNPNNLDSKVPNLAGQNADYIANQLYHFKKGERKHILMESIARGLTDLEIQWVSGAFGGLDLNQEAVETPTVPDGVNVGICNGCHLNDVNRSTTGKIPNIAGQKKDYLLVQLNNFKSDQRTDFATSFMNGFVKTLTPEQFEKLSDYYSKLRVKNNDYGDYYKSEEPPEPTLPPEQPPAPEPAPPEHEPDPAPTPIPEQPAPDPVEPVPPAPEPPTEEVVTYEDVKSILTGSKCNACHRAGNSNTPVGVPPDWSNVEHVKTSFERGAFQKRVVEKDPSPMPPVGFNLTDDEFSLLKKWIDGGGKIRP